MFFNDRPREFFVNTMPRSHGDDVTADAGTNQRQVTDNVEDFVAREFICEPQRFFAQDGLTSHHNGVFQTATFNQIFVHYRLDFLVVNKSARRGDLMLEDRWRYLGGIELREAMVRTCWRTGNERLWVWHACQQR